MKQIDNTVMIKVKELEYLNKHSSKDETRMHFNGVAFQSGVTVATNGHTLKYIDSCEFLHDVTYIIPRYAIDGLLKLLKGYKIKSEYISLSFNEDFACFECSDFTYKMKLIKREYPKWRSAVPVKFQHTVKVDDWILEYKRYKKSLDNKTRKVILKGIEGDLWLCGGDESNEVHIGCYAWNSEDNNNFELGFNCDLLELASEGLKEFEIKFNGALNPVSVNGVIVMPLKL